MTARVATFALLALAAVALAPTAVATARIENGKAFLFTSSKCEED